MRNCAATDRVNHLWGPVNQSAVTLRAVIAALFTIVVSVGVGWIADGIAAWAWSDTAPTDLSWAFWAGLAIIVLAACASVLAGFELPHLRTIFGNVKQLFGALVITPAAVAWVSDGLATGTWIQAGIGTLALAGSVALLVYGLRAARDAVGGRPLPPYEQFPPEELADATTLIASVGPKGLYPKALLHTIKAMPKLQLVISIDDGYPETGENGNQLPPTEQGGSQGVDKHLELLDRYHPARRESRPRIEHFTMPSNQRATKTAITDLINRLQTLVDDEDKVIVDVTGGRVPQSLAVYDAARRLNYPALYVVATEPKDLASKLYKDRADAERGDLERYLATVDGTRDANIKLQFARLLKREPSPFDFDVDLNAHPGS